MNQLERTAEVTKIKRDNAAILSTPLMSEGGISPTQVNRMGNRQREAWQRNAQQRMSLESDIRLLLRSDAEIEAETLRLAAEKRRGRLAQINAVLPHLIQQGTSSKTGKVRPTYRAEIERLSQEKELLEQDTIVVD